MKTLGLLGGMSWESTIPYYRIINETVRERLGGLHSARLILYSVDLHAMWRDSRFISSNRRVCDPSARWYGREGREASPCSDWAA